MTKLILILSAVIVILMGLLGITYKQMRTQRSEAIRWEHNYEQSQEDISRIELTYREFKDQATAKEDSLLKELSIKPKQVERIVYIENEYTNTDTTEIDFIITGDEVVDIPERPKTLKFISRIDCIQIEGMVTTKDPRTSLSVTSIQYNNSFSYVAYWERRQWKFLGIKSKLFGKKQGELKISSACGKSTVKEIDIIKKK